MSRVEISISAFIAVASMAAKLRICASGTLRSASSLVKKSTPFAIISMTSPAFLVNWLAADIDALSHCTTVCEKVLSVSWIVSANVLIAPLGICPSWPILPKASTPFATRSTSLLARSSIAVTALGLAVLIPIAMPSTIGAPTCSAITADGEWMPIICRIGPGMLATAFASQAVTLPHPAVRPALIPSTTDEPILVASRSSACWALAIQLLILAWMLPRMPGNLGSTSVATQPVSAMPHCLILSASTAAVSMINAPSASTIPPSATMKPGICGAIQLTKAIAHRPSCASSGPTAPAIQSRNAPSIPGQAARNDTVAPGIQSRNAWPHTASCAASTPTCAPIQPSSWPSSPPIPPSATMKPGICGAIQLTKAIAHRPSCASSGPTAPAIQSRNAPSIPGQAARNDTVAPGIQSRNAWPHTASCAASTPTCAPIQPSSWPSSPPSAPSAAPAAGATQSMNACPHVIS